MTDLTSEPLATNDTDGNSKQRDRRVDALIFSHVVVTLLMGYMSESRTGWRPTDYSFPTVISAQLILITFFGCVVPLMSGARLACIVIAPLVPFVVFNLGGLIALRLDRPRATGLDQIYRMIPLTVPAFLIALVFWLVFGLFGWNLLKPDASTKPRTFQLHHLLASVGIFCCGLVLMRDSLSLQSILDGLERMASEPYIAFVFLALPCCVQLIPCVWVGFRMNPIAVIPICCVWMTLSNFAHFQLMSDDSFRFRYAYQGWSGFAIVLVTVLALRWFGYQLVRTTKSAQAPSIAHSDRA